MGKVLRFLDDSKKGLDERVGSGVMTFMICLTPGLHPGLVDGALAGLGERSRLVPSTLPKYRLMLLSCIFA